MARRAPDPLQRNRLLTALPAAERERLRPHLAPAELDLRQVLVEVDTPIPAVFFPVDAVVSFLSVMADGSSVEVATIGPEGLVGLPLALGTDRTPGQAFVQIPGRALRMEAAVVQAEMARGGAFAHVVHRYTQALFTFLAQSSACNRLHAIPERCARWLLLTHDRVGGPSFPMTHEFLAQMLGVRRATVTEALGPLQEEGLIQYHRGRLEVVDRKGLEAAACECHAIISHEFDRLLDGGLPLPLLQAMKRRTSRGGRPVAGPPRTRRSKGARG